MSSRYVVAVQMKVSLGDYRDEAYFSERINDLLSDARRRVTRSVIPVVVLPEDIGLGMLFMDDYAEVRGCRSIYEAAQRLFQRYAEPIRRLVNLYRISERRALQLVLGRKLEARYRRLFAEAARRHRVFLVAGSAPLPHPQREAEVYNTSYTFDNRGRLVLVQRKVHLIPLEQEQGMDLNAGSPQEVKSINTPAGRLGIAICLDGFHQVVIDILWRQGAQLIAQPSFNPLPWTVEQAEGWKMGLWQACQDYPGLVGINPMMVGRLFDLVVEGRSSIVTHSERTPDRSGYLAQAVSATEEEVLVSELPS